MWWRRAFPLGAVLALAVLSACTVRPMYSDAGSRTGSVAGRPGTGLIDVKPETTRVGLETRNQLIFLLNGGDAQPVDAPYSVQLSVVASSRATAVIQNTKDTEPTAGSVTVSSRYTIQDNSTGTVVAVGTRSVSSSFDVSRQEFAALRALRDAEDRGARELAELLNHAMIQELERIKARG